MDKKIVIRFAVLTMAVLIGGILFLSQVNTTPNLHRATLGTSQQNPSNTNTNTANEKPKPPDFTLPKYNGSGNVNLVSSYNYKPTIIQFWATWCEFCRREFPVTNAIVATQEGKINYIAVNFSQESKDTVSAYVKELNLNPNILTFVMDGDGSVGRAYGITGTPVHIFIKKGGEVSLFRVGYMNPQDMKDEIAKII